LHPMIDQDKIVAPAVHLVKGDAMLHSFVGADLCVRPAWAHTQVHPYDFRNSGIDSPQISWRYVSRFLIT
jgi:hypothetical protein